MDVIADYACLIGENPLWNEGEKALYWNDITTGRLFRYDWIRRTSRIIRDEGSVIGGFTFEEDGALLLFMERGRVARFREGEALETIIEENLEIASVRFNDVMATKEGGVFCGTMPKEERTASLYNLDPEKKFTPLMRNVTLSNGLAYTPDEASLYYADTRDSVVYRFFINPETRLPENPQPFFDFHNEPGRPDGLCVDKEGFVWVAEFGGGCIIRISPEGIVERRVEVPVKKVTSLAFGGEDLTDIFITTGGGAERRDGGVEGALFHANLGIAGHCEYRSRIGVK